MIVLSYMDTKIENPLVIDTTNTVKKDEKVFEQNKIDAPVQLRVIQNI